MRTVQFPYVSTQPPVTNTQFYPHTGKPTIGDPAVVTLDEFYSQRAVFKRGCYGVFDTAKPDQVQFGRTYHEILTKTATGEFRLIGDRRYEWVTCSKYGCRPLVFVEWAELTESTLSQVRKDPVAGQYLK